MNKLWVICTAGVLLCTELRAQENDTAATQSVALSMRDTTPILQTTSTEKPKIYKVNNALEIPLIVYPNAGLNYDLSTALYTVDGVQADVWRQALDLWTQNGVGIIGGCCGSGPGDITAIRKSIQR